MSTPAKLWSSLDADLRTLAAEAFYRHDWGDRPAEMPTPLSDWLDRREAAQPMAS